MRAGWLAVMEGNLLSPHRSKQSLEEWREEMRLMQQHAHVSPHHSTTSLAPFATETPQSPEREADEERGASLPAGLHEQREAAFDECVRRYVSELRGQRVQAGLVREPSDDLLEAEKRLAEVRERESLSDHWVHVHN